MGPAPPQAPLLQESQSPRPRSRPRATGRRVPLQLQGCGSEQQPRGMGGSGARHGPGPAQPCSDTEGFAGSVQTKGEATVGRGPTLGDPAGLAAWVGLGHPGAWAVPAAEQKFGGRGRGAETPAAAVLWARGFRFVYLRQIIAAFTSSIPEVLNGSRSLRLSRAASTSPVQAAGTPCRSPRCGGAGWRGRRRAQRASPWRPVLFARRKCWGTPGSGRPPT